MRIELFTSGAKLPPLIEGDPTHSSQMFHSIEQTTDASPLMLVAYDGDKETAHLLVVKNRSLRLLPPGLYVWYSIYGEGVYSSRCNDKEALFAMMLEKLFTIFDYHHTFIEVRNLKDSRFAYNILSEKFFFPLRDNRIYISLHSRDPWQRLTRTYRSHIRKALERGVTFGSVTTEEEKEKALRIMHKYYMSKLRNRLPSIDFLRTMLTPQENNIEKARLFVVRHKGEIIGCSICIYEKERAYLAYSCGLRKSHPLLYPGIMSVWAAITDAHSRGIPHFEFLEPKGSNIPSGYLNFILNFGGKQVGTLHWYHFKWNCINKIMRAIYV